MDCGMSADTSERARQFDELYRGAIDPWHFRTSDYERDKYRATLDALPRARYRRALEVGCSIGELSRLLAARADEVLGLDVSGVAVAEASRVHGAVPGLRFEVRELPRDWPDGTWDLVVLSEVLYFLEPEEIDGLAERVAATLEPGGHCALVCWLGENDRTLDGDGAARRFIDAFTGPGAGMRDGTGAGTVESALRAPDYRLDLLRREPSGPRPVPIGTTSRRTPP